MIFILTVLFHEGGSPAKRTLRLKKTMQRSNIMPLITIESGNLTTKQKEELIEKMTAVASEITNIPSEFFLVTIKELPDSNIGIGGKTIDRIKAEYKK